MLLSGVFLPGCTDDDMENIPMKEAPSGVTIQVTPSRAATDEADNLPEEYAVLNLSLFLTDAGSEDVTDRFVHQPSTSVRSVDMLNCRRVSLPLDAAVLSRKDIYVVANYDDKATLESIRTLDDLRALTTPKLQGTRYMITTERGLPMYGEALDVDMSRLEEAPLNMMLQRLCAKIEVLVDFTDPTWVGTNNRFAIDNAASYTYFVPNSSFSIAAADLVSYPGIMMEQLSDTQFRHISYVYESMTLPYMQLYTVVGGKLREYVAKDNFPLPVRNRLYHVLIEMLPPLTAGTTRSATGARADDTLAIGMMQITDVRVSAF
jgi:hypothetical protein